MTNNKVERMEPVTYQGFRVEPIENENSIPINQNLKMKMSQLRASLPLGLTTPPLWAEVATANIPHFLQDHASCERKAHAAAMMLVNRYPDYPELQDRMIGLAREELLHFQQVVGLLRQRNLTIPQDEVNPYVKSLMTFVRHPKELHLLDRLLVAAVIEARSCERFCLFAEHVKDVALQEFYTDFAIEESAHFPLMVETAKTYYPSNVVDDALTSLFVKEAEIVAKLPILPIVH
jgi:tRNA-(ms[2]io[6]A)-hydroxylase